MTVTIVCIEPENPGNIGAIARAMSNFGLERLMLINPKCDHKSAESRNRAKHAQDVLDNARTGDWSLLDGFDYLIATSAKLGTDYNIPRSPLTAQQMAEKLNDESEVALLLGRESTGLTNDEIAKCDFIVSIPAAQKYPTLNLSHAAAILFYEIFKAAGKNKTNEHIEMADKTYKDVIINKIDNILANMKFATEEKKETQKLVWKRVIAKSMLTKREAFAMLGFLRKLEGDDDEE